jgi:hypothetical protein
MPVVFGRLFTWIWPTTACDRPLRLTLSILFSPISELFKLYHAPLSRCGRHPAILTAMGSWVLPIPPPDPQFQIYPPQRKSYSIRPPVKQKGNSDRAESVFQITRNHRTRNGLLPGVGQGEPKRTPPFVFYILNLCSRFYQDVIWIQNICGGGEVFRILIGSQERA